MTITTSWKKIYLPKDIYIKTKYRPQSLKKYFIFKTYNRNVTISSLFNNAIIKVYNGKRFLTFKTNSLQFGKKYKNFIKTIK